MKDLQKRAKEIISKILYINIATSDKNGDPWNSPVYSAFDENYNFYWISWTENQHSKNIKENNKAFITIYDSRVSEGKGEGIYILAKAQEINDKKEIEHALKYLDGRVGVVGRHSFARLSGSMPRRVYKAVPKKVWMNIDGSIDGEYVDKRAEIKLK